MLYLILKQVKIDETLEPNDKNNTMWKLFKEVILLLTKLLQGPNL